MQRLAAEAKRLNQQVKVDEEAKRGLRKGKISYITIDA